MDIENAYKPPKYNLLTDAQLRAEVDKCLHCKRRPCTSACPAGVSPMDFIFCLKKPVWDKSDFERAAGMILKRNPLGHTCGVLCGVDAACMAKCSRKRIDAPIRIPDVQATIISKAIELNAMPTLLAKDDEGLKGKSVVVVGAGAGGLACSAYLAARCIKVDLYEQKKLGGSLRYIPEHRLPASFLDGDIDRLIALTAKNLSIHVLEENQSLEELEKGVDALVHAYPPPSSDNIPYEFCTAEHGVVSSEAVLDSTAKFENKSKAVVLTSSKCDSMTAADTAVKLRMDGFETVTIVGFNSGKYFSAELLEILKKADVKAIQSATPTGVQKGAVIVDLYGSAVPLNCDTVVAVAKKASATVFKDLRKERFQLSSSTTAVEAIAAGKSLGVEVYNFLQTCKKDLAKKPLKSDEDVFSFPNIPTEVSMETSFFGKRIANPFILSASPLTDGYDLAAKGLRMGWAGVVMKTAFDGLDIHVPSEYMNRYGQNTYGNCDNVSSHSLNRVCSEIVKLKETFPSKLIIGSTGGPVTGHASDRVGWASNTNKIEHAGADAIEYSLSCPQGGDSAEGAIASQNAELSAKIVDYVMESGNGEIPKIFKLTGAVTSVKKILNAIVAVFEKYPEKKAGVTLANSFPSMAFKNFGEKGDRGVVVGMSGEGIVPISYLSLAEASSIPNLVISGNGGVMDSKAAFNFLALGCNSVQFCTLPEVEGLDVIDELISGVAYYMKSIGQNSLESHTIGSLKKEPIINFDDLEAVSKVPEINSRLCIGCCNCMRCPYGAITSKGWKLIVNPGDCVGCSLCSLKCPAQAISMRKRTGDEVKMYLKKHKC